MPKSLTNGKMYDKIGNCNPLSQGTKTLEISNCLNLRISEYTNKGGAF